MFVAHFQDSVTEVGTLFGDLAFSVFDRKMNVLSKFNAAVYDSQLVGVGILVQQHRLARMSRKQASAAMVSLLENPDYQYMISKATSDDKNVKGRISAFVEAFGQ